jgi:hypothetical protein
LKIFFREPAGDTTGVVKIGLAEFFSKIGLFPFYEEKVQTKPSKKKIKEQEDAPKDKKYTQPNA